MNRHEVAYISVVVGKSERNLMEAGVVVAEIIRQIQHHAVKSRILIGAQTERTTVAQLERLSSVAGSRPNRELGAVRNVLEVRSDLIATVVHEGNLTVTRVVAGLLEVARICEPRFHLKEIPVEKR